MQDDKNGTGTRAGPSGEARPKTLHDGKDGWRYHWRHGLVGAVNYWAAGSRDNVVKMLVALAKDEFGVSQEVADKLRPDRELLATKCAIARHLKEVVDSLKTNGSEDQRKEYGIILAAAFGAPSPVSHLASHRTSHDWRLSRIPL